MLRALTSRRGSTRLVRRVRILHAAHTPRTHTPRTPHVHAVLGSILTLEYSTPHTRRTRHKHWGAITAWRSRSVGVRLVIGWWYAHTPHERTLHARRIYTPHVHLHRRLRLSAQVPRPLPAVARAGCPLVLPRHTELLCHPGHLAKLHRRARWLGLGLGLGLRRPGTAPNYTDVRALTTRLPNDPPP